MRTASIANPLLSLSCLLSLVQPAWSQENKLDAPPQASGVSPPAVALPAADPAVTPAQVDNSVKSQGDPLAPELRAPLSGQVISDALTGSASLNGRAVRVSISNTGARAMIIDGDAAWLDSGSPDKGGRKPGARSLDDLVSPPRKTDVPEDFVVTGAAISTLGVVPVAADIVHKARAGGPAYYGKDQDRRQMSARLLGERVLFPGDTTAGDVILSRTAKVGQALVVPIKSHPDGASLGDLKLDIK